MGNIQLVGVNKWYETSQANYFQALKNIHMEIKEGECLSLIGGSGSGKSTLGKIILGLERPSTGRVFIDEKDVSNLSFKEWSKLRTSVQGVFQDSTGTLNPAMSVYNNMQETLVNLTQLSKKQRKEKILCLMNKLNIDQGLLKTPVRALSGGEQRRVSLIRALVVEPKYIVLDEVVSGLDLLSQKLVMNTLKQYRREFGCSYLFITHDMKSAYELSDRIIEVENGCLFKIGICSR